MAKDKPPSIEVKTFPDHHVITQPNPLRKVLRRVGEKDQDDPVARAEQALAGLSGEFKNWMLIEASRLATAHAAIVQDGFASARLCPGIHVLACVVVTKGVDGRDKPTSVWHGLCFIKPPSSWRHEHDYSSAVAPRGLHVVGSQIWAVVAQEVE